MTDPLATGTVPKIAAAINTSLSVQLPPFQTDDPQLWFAQAQLQFDVLGINADAARFNAVQIHLHQHAKEVRDILIDPPSEGRYEFFKTELIKRLSTSQAQKTRQFLRDEQMGDRTPTQFLRVLRELAGNNVQDDVLKEIWLSRLPERVRPILATVNDWTLDKIAQTADEVFQTLKVDHDYGVARAAPPPSDDRLDALAAQTSSLMREMADLKRECQNRPNWAEGNYRRNNNGDNRRQRSRSRSSSQNSKLCWYHDKFANQAQNCHQPCEYTKN